MPNRTSLMPTAPAPQTIGEVVAGYLSEVPHVKMVQLGQSEAVCRVWTTTDKWTPVGRKEIYAVQRKLLEILNGFEVDFYLVALTPGEPPAKTAGLPVIFERQ